MGYSNNNYHDFIFGVISFGSQEKESKVVTSTNKDGTANMYIKVEPRNVSLAGTEDLE